MKRHLFICGPAFSGRSGLIRRTLGAGLAEAGGFCTELTGEPGGGLLGCTLFPAAAAGGAEGFEKELFLDLRTDPPGHDSEVFRNTGVRLLEESVYYPFAVLDEIGGIDVLIPQFREALDGILRSQLPILGVVRSEEDGRNLKALLGLGERYLGLRDGLEEKLRRDPGTEIVGMDRAEDAVRAWAAAYAGRKS